MSDSNKSCGLNFPIHSQGSSNYRTQEGEEYKARGLRYFNYGSVTEEMLVDNPRLFKVPIVRNGRKATVGYRPEVWKTWE